MIDKLLAPEVQNFIKDHEKDDPLSLILKNKAVHDVPVKIIAAQIAARKKARHKLPQWYHTAGIIYPPLLSMEQCSSEATAKYKASLVSGSVLFDLTGGAGVDTYYIGNQFNAVFYVEQNSELFNITTHNFSHLGADNIKCINDTAEAFLSKSDRKATVIYLDPARRGQNAQKVFRLEDCEPDVIKLLPELISKADTLMIKASPMLDIDLSIKDLKYVHEVHVISVGNECKEVVYMLKMNNTSDPLITTINFKKSGHKEVFSFQRSTETKAQVNYALPKNYLYEPNSSILKAGAFQLVGSMYNVNKLHQHTHLYTSASEINDFPGRRFRIITIAPYNKKAVAPFLPEKKANVSTRNFPEEVKNIKKKLGLKDGGDKFLFAFTDLDEHKKIAITEKIL